MGKIVNNEYELLEQLGQGGMGVVYKARHIHFGENFAIKRLWEQFSNDPTVLELFRNEGKILRSLHHRNIVQVSGLFAFEGSHYIVMEYIEGRTLSEIIKRETGPIQRDRAIKLFKQMLEGVAYIHNQPKTIIHRDLKPLNILVTSDDTVKITDFGIAKALEAGGQASTVVKGTPVYMSPEQIINPKTVDIRTDVYALGMTFYEMLCAKTPFQGDTATTPTAVYAAIMNGEVPPPTEFYPGISDELSAFVMKAIHKDRNQRFANASEMLRELVRLEGRGETAFTDKTVISHLNLVHLTDPTDSYEVTHEVEGDKNLNANQSASNQKDFELRDAKKFLSLAIITIISVIVVGFLFSILKNKNFPKESQNLEATSAGDSSVFLTLEQQKEMVLVEGGIFEMGSNLGKTDEKPPHSVKLNSFMIGRYEVTQDLWTKVMTSNPSKFKDRNYPVDQVSWLEAVEFCNKLSEKEGLIKSYNFIGKDVYCDFSSNGYRLPTEAEWEYAARGGVKSQGYKFSGSNDVNSVAWFSENSRNGPARIGSKQMNELGIYDMSGNVWEWCWDWYSDSHYSNQAVANPKGSTAGFYRILRGGGWSYFPDGCRVSYRFSGFTPDFGSEYVGFRLARSVK